MQIARDIAGFPRRPLLSILLPTHNSAERWLRRCLDSVCGQLYPAWELCVADDASSEPTVRAVLEEYRALDARIKVAYRAQNGHISRATNSALELATGEFAVLLDHDDELAEDALYWVAREIIESPDAMLIYSDEDKLNESDIRFDPYFKPDWNPELLRAQNCISHLGALRTDALRAIGGFRAGLEGAQDWDVALRLSERCEPEAIRHIPRVLYHWRTAAASTAQSMQGKPYASAAQRQVIAEHLTRIGRAGKIEPVVRGNFWRVNYQTRPESPTTVLVDGRGSIDLLRCTLTALGGARDRTIESFRLGVQVLARPKILATDDSTTEDVILHFRTLVDFDIVATIQATSPLVSSTDLDLAMEQFLREGSDSLFTGVQVRRFFWSIDG